MHDPPQAKLRVGPTAGGGVEWPDGDLHCTRAQWERMGRLVAAALAELGGTVLAVRRAPALAVKPKPTGPSLARAAVAAGMTGKRDAPECLRWSSCSTGRRARRSARPCGR